MIKRDIWHRFTDAASRAVRFAGLEASEHHQSVVETEHLLIGLLREGGQAAQALQQQGVIIEEVRDVIATHAAPPVYTKSARTSSRQRLSSQAKQVLRVAWVNCTSEATTDDARRVDTCHLLYGLLHVQSEVTLILHRLQVDPTLILRLPDGTPDRSVCQVQRNDLLVVDRANKPIWGMFALGSYAVSMVLYGVCHRFESLGGGLWSFSSFYSHPYLSLLILIAGLLIYAGLIALHEFIHMLVFKLLGKAPWKTITCKVVRDHPDDILPRMLYVFCTFPIHRSAYRWSLVMPLLLLGIIPWIISLCLGYGIVYFFATLFIINSFGDLSILWRSRHNNKRYWRTGTPRII